MTDPFARLGAMLDGLPEQIAEAQRQAAEFANRQFVADSADGYATARVDGAGRVVAISTLASALRKLDNHTLGERIAEAINNALDAGEQARDELLAGDGTTGPSDLGGVQEVFDHRIGELHRTLDAISARLSRLT